MSQQNPWAQFAKVLQQQSQKAGKNAKPPKGLFAGLGGLIFLGATGLVLSSSLYNGVYFLFGFLSSGLMLILKSKLSL